MVDHYERKGSFRGYQAYAGGLEFTYGTVGIKVLSAGIRLLLPNREHEPDESAKHSMINLCFTVNVGTLSNEA